MHKQQYTKFCESDFFKNELKNICEKNITKILKTTNIINDNFESYRNDNFYFLSDILIPNNRIEKTLHSMIFDNIKKIENISANSSFFFFLFSMNLLLETLKNENVFNVNQIDYNKNIEIILEKLKNFTFYNSNVITKQQLKKTLKNICEDNDLYEAIFAAIELSGLEGKISIKDSSSNNHYIVELNNGYNFNNLETFKIFFENGLFWERKNVKVLIVDGIIEKVSSLNNLLNKSLETKNPMIIVASGFSEEVIATLKCNNDRKLFDIIPIIVPSAIENINLINDIGVACNSDIISTLKGEQLQFINYDNLSFVDNIYCSNKQLNIENYKNTSSVAAHIKNIIKKREENIHIQDIINILDGRIKNLLSHSVSISLPNFNEIEKKSIKTKIDVCLRTIKTLTNYGVINNFNKLELLNHTNNIEKIIFNSIQKTIKQMNKNQYSSLSFFLGTMFGIKMVSTLLFSRGFVELI